MIQCSYTTVVWLPTNAQFMELWDQIICKQVFQLQTSTKVFLMRFRYWDHLKLDTFWQYCVTSQIAMTNSKSSYKRIVTEAHIKKHVRRLFVRIPNYISLYNTLPWPDFVHIFDLQIYLTSNPPCRVCVQSFTMPQYLKRRFGGLRLQICYAVTQLMLFILIGISVELLLHF